MVTSLQKKKINRLTGVTKIVRFLYGNVKFGSNVSKCEIYFQAISTTVLLININDSTENFQYNTHQ